MGVQQLQHIQCLDVVPLCIIKMAQDIQEEEDTWVVALEALVREAAVLQEEEPLEQQFASSCPKLLRIGSC